MIKMTAACLGVVVIAIYLSTQVNSQNATIATNQTYATQNVSTVTTTANTYSSMGSGNSTTNPKGAAHPLQSSTIVLLLPLTVSASILRLCC